MAKETYRARGEAWLNLSIFPSAPSSLKCIPPLASRIALRKKAWGWELTDPVAFDTSRNISTQIVAHLLPERILAQSRFLSLDSTVLLADVCCRACVARWQAAVSLDCGSERARTP